MDSNLSVSISLDDQMPPASAFDVDGQPAFTPPADAAINVRIVANPDGRHVFVYDVPDGGFALQLPGPTDNWHVAFWSTRSGANYARVGSASLALAEALANHPDPVLKLNVARALLSRRAEFVWRDLDTPERVAADHVTAYAENLRFDGRCDMCEEPLDGPHPANCPVTEDALRAAADRARAIGSLADLDTRSAAIRAQAGRHVDCPSVAWQEVTCDRCGRTYQCRPESDYYCAAEGDHCCEPCLIKGMGVDGLVVLTPQEY